MRVFCYMASGDELSRVLPVFIVTFSIFCANFTRLSTLYCEHLGILKFFNRKFF